MYLCGSSVLVVTADCFGKGARGSLSILMSDLFLVTLSQDLAPLCSFNYPSFTRQHTTSLCLPFFLSTLYQHQPQPLACPHQLSPTNALPLSLSYPSPPSSQPFLTSLGLEICLSILIPLCQEFWIFITRIHPFFFGNDLEKGGHLLIAHALPRFDNTFWSR